MGTRGLHVPRPSGYDKSHEKPCQSRGDCVIGVGFDLSGSNVTRFQVDLQYMESFVPPSYTQIARIDHNPANPNGHDIHSEGIHVDAITNHGRNRRYKPHCTYIPINLDVVIRGCANYFHQNAKFFVDFYTGSKKSGNAPGWSP